MQLLDIVCEPGTNTRTREVVNLGAMQAPQALNTDPKQWAGLRKFVAAAEKLKLTPPTDLEGVAANDTEADEFMAQHGSVLLGGKNSKYVRPFVRRKRLRSMLSSLSASSNAAVAASFWQVKTVADLTTMVPDMSEALTSLPQDMAVLDVARMFELSPVTGPLLLSMAACFWGSALGGKFGDVARRASARPEAMGQAYAAYFEENGINVSVPVLVGTTHLLDAVEDAPPSKKRPCCPPSSLAETSSTSGALSACPAPLRAHGRRRTSDSNGPAPSRANKRPRASDKRCPPAQGPSSAAGE